MIRLPSGRFMLKPSQEIPEIYPWQPADHLYAGKIYVLINGGTFSAAGIFAAYLHAHKKAIFIGEESGSDHFSLNGHSIPGILPNTQVKIMIPVLQHYYNSDINYKNTGRGVIPDYHILPNIQDLINGKDTELDFTKTLILTLER